MKFGLSCLTAGVFALALTAGSAAQAASKTLNVNVYQLCETDGSNCASLGPVGNSFFSAETNAIWAQADIAVNFTFKNKINDSTYAYLTGNEFEALAPYSFSTVDMYLVHTIEGAFGLGWEGAGGVAIAMDNVMAFGNGGRIDTIAHELGHNLGLLMVADGGVDGHSTNPLHLMAGGGIRLVPNGIANIAPNGTGYDLLPANQIAIARQSGLLITTPVPEPGEWAMMIAGLAVVGFAARRKRAAA